MYIHQQKDWPRLTWDNAALATLLAEVRHQQGRLLGRMESLGFTLQSEATLQVLTQEVLKTSEIEGEILHPEQVRSSVARHLGIEAAGLVPSDRDVDGIVELMLDATQNYPLPLTDERLFGWHSALFPSGRNGMHKITAGGWREEAGGPMQVVSGPMGRERVHFEAPDSGRLPQEMDRFLDWFNGEAALDPVLKAALAHFWFVTVHPFDDGNGRIARAIADLQLARADGMRQRFYSMSAQIRLDRKAYYAILEETQRGPLDITAWMEWFLACLQKALLASEVTLSKVLNKARFWDAHAGKAFSPRQQKMLNLLLEGFEGNLTTSKWAKITKASQDTALRDIQDLVEQQVLLQEPGGGRSTRYGLAPLP